MSDAKPHIALWGAGNIGQRHADEIRRIGKLVAVVDPISSAALAASGGNPTICFSSTEAFWAAQIQVDVVVIATPNYLHASQSVDAMQHGAHVLCEKPMAILATDAQRMVEAALHYQRQLLVVKQNRYNPPVAWVRQLIQEGKLGQLTNIHLSCFWHRPASYYADSWRGKKQTDGGTLYTQFSHFIDLLLWVAGPLELGDVALSNHQHQGIMETEDTGVIRWTSAAGATVSMHYSVNSFSKNTEGSMLILGTKGTVKIGGQYLNQLSWADVADVTLPTWVDRDQPNDYGTYQGSMRNHHLVYDNLLAIWQGKAGPDVQMEEGLRCVETIEAVYQWKK
jgi:predicted dehydrogenase